MELTRRQLQAATCAALWLVASAYAVDERIENGGNLILQDIPEIPAALVDDLVRYQNVRTGIFMDWDDSGGLYILTRFGDLRQLHHVAGPGAARYQLTFFPEPVGYTAKQPGGAKLAFTMDAGGNEFAQIFLFDPETGDATMLTDGESRNGGILWDKQGELLAYRSTRRNGRSNDLWIMDPTAPANARVIFTAQDGSSWTAVDFSADRRYLLVNNYVSINESSVRLLDIHTGDMRRLTEVTGSNLAAGFARDGFLFTTDRGGEFTELAWAPLEDPNEVQILTADIPWDVELIQISKGGRRAAFSVNKNGYDHLYLLDLKRFTYAPVELPVGLLGWVAFAPDDRALAMSISTPTSPTDTYVLDLKRSPTSHGKLTRWTESEVGGLNTANFVTPEILKYPTFDGRNIPAIVYRPRGNGPHPVIVAIHGGPESQARPGFSSTYQMWIQKLDAAVIRPNVRGSSGYGKSYLRLDNGRLRENSVKDIGALLDWIETQPDLDESRVAVTGGSYGGYMVLASAVHYSDRLVAGIDRVGISNFVTFLTNTQDYRRDLRRPEYGDERDPAMRAFLESISPLNHTEQIKIPMLVVQGQNDPRVPVTESEQLVERMRANGQDVWYINALNEGHGYRRKENRDIYQQATVLFLQKHLAR
jgi:dipeptidyl aminopeptidase/acylaminoacyl peptidase